MNLLIPITILLPLVVGLAMILAGSRGRVAVPIALATTFLTALLCVKLCYDTHVAADPEVAAIATVSPVLEFAPDWLSLRLPVGFGGEPLRWQLSFGLDGIGALMVLLTGLTFAVTCVFAVGQIRDRLPLYMALMLISQSVLLGVFMSMDLITFYICFEAILLPSTALIAWWGRSEIAGKAARKFLLFTLAGSFPMIVGLIGIAFQAYQTHGVSTVQFAELSALAAQTQDAVLVAGDSAAAELAQSQQWIVALLLLGFGIKMAILPLHTWLPTAYEAAHTNTTAIVASVIAKLGVFGLLRIVLPLTPLALAQWGQMLFAGLGALAIVYGALNALAQTDLRRVFAYSSISHMGFVTIGLMSMNVDGISGAALQMFNHGVITCALFLLLGAMEQRRPDIQFTMRDLGMASRSPYLAVFLVFFTFAASGLPGLNGFVGEFLTLVGITQVQPLITGVAVLGTVLGAWYGLRVLQNMMFGSDGAESERRGRDVAERPEIVRVLGGDLRTAELACLGLLLVVCLYIGVRPMGPMRLFDSEVQRIATVTEPASNLATVPSGRLATVASK